MDFSSFWPFSSPSKQAAAANADGAAASDSRHGINAASINGGPGAALVSSVGRPPSASGTGSLVLPGSDIDLNKYLVGAWKRNLEWREFGHDFAHVRESNSIVVIEEYHRLDSEAGARYHRWSFGRSLQRADLRSGYVMKMVPNLKANEIQLEWQYGGTTCHGRFVPAPNVMVLQFMLKTAVITATYRIVDANMMAVCIVEVEEKKEPTIQYGNMYRLDPASYTSPSD